MAGSLTKSGKSFMVIRLHMTNVGMGTEFAKRNSIKPAGNYGRQQWHTPVQVAGSEKHQTTIYYLFM